MRNSYPYTNALGFVAQKMDNRRGNLRFRSDGGESTHERHDDEYYCEDPMDYTNDSKTNQVLKFFDSLPSVGALTIFIGLCLVGSLVYVIDSRLPTPLTFQDVGIYPHSFVAERAQAHLHRLVSLGSKPTGSYENEVLAVDYISKEISFAIQHASPPHKITYDIQKPTGSFHLAMKPPFTSYYTGVQNIVVRLSSTESNSSSALLVNCHFDSVPTSPGGSDDGINCAVLLEILRVLSLSPAPLVHDVIFLFNGAEENILQAAHGFITQHKWAKDIKAFINLEACGAGGREVLFQTSPKHPWLLEAYAQSAPHPHGFVFGEELFQSGIIPSDTDFRIFRDFGNIPGLDFAFARNGYVYHTKYDNEDQIPPGSFQHVGDNILALVQKIANSEELGAPHDHSSAGLVYWDILGLYLVRYSFTTGTILNVLVSVWSAYSLVGTLLYIGRGGLRTVLLREFRALLLGTILGHCLPLGYAVVLAFFVDWTNCALSWYSQPLLVIPLYCVPTVLMLAVGPIIQTNVSNQSSLSLSIRFRLYTLATQLLWTLFLVAGTILQLRSAYVFVLPVLFPTILTTFMMWCAPPHFKLNSWMWLHLICILPHVIMTVYHGVLALSLFIPMTGRMGSSKSTEHLIAVLTTLLSMSATNYLVPAIFALRRAVTVLYSLGLVHFMTLLALLFTDLFFPYSVVEPSGVFPHRVYLSHVHRELHGEMGHVRYSDSGFWMIPMDRNAPRILMNDLPEFQSASTASLFCDTEIFCALPLSSPRVMDYSQNSLWLTGPKPTVYQPSSLELVDQKVVQVSAKTSTRMLTFLISGPDHMAVMFSPVLHAQVTSWNLQAELLPSYFHKERPVYFIYYGRGMESRPWNFSLSIEVPVSHSGYILDLTLAGHYLHGAKHYTKAFSDLISRFPSWAHVTPSISTVKSWRL